MSFYVKGQDCFVPEQNLYDMGQIAKFSSKKVCFIIVQNFLDQPNIFCYFGAMEAQGIIERESFSMEITN